jgi:hypothetical protein
VVEDETNDGGEGQDRLHGDAGRRMDGTHKNAHGRHTEVRTRKLEPLRPREPRLDPASPCTGKGHAHQPLVLASREHEERTVRKTQLFQPLVKCLQRPQVRRHSPYRVKTRNTHVAPSLPTLQSEVATAPTNGAAGQNNRLKC